MQVWKEGLKLLKQVYYYTNKFPSLERYGLVSQMQRSSTSILANIAEGFSRTSADDKAYKYVIARGECSEVCALLIISNELDYLSESETKPLIDATDTIGKMLSGLIHYHKNK